MVLGCDSCIGAAVDGGRQHHETHNPTHHPCYDDGGHGVAQISWPWLGFDLHTPGGLAPLCCGCRRAWGQPGGQHLAAVPVKTAGVEKEKGRGGTAREGFKEVLSLPSVW